MTDRNKLSTSEKSLGSGDGHVLVSGDPVAFEQLLHEPVEPARSAVVDFLRQALVAEPGGSQARAEPLVMVVHGLADEQQRQPVSMV